MANEIVSEVLIELSGISLDHTLISDALENTELGMVSSCGDSEMLWMDSYLDQIPVFKTRDFSEAEYRKLTDQFMFELYKPTKNFIRLMCVFITNMDNIFEGKKEKWFPEPLPNQKTIDISDVLDECVGDYHPVDRTVSYTRRNGYYYSKTVNHKYFYAEVTKSADTSRNTLAALSLGILQIYFRDSKRWLREIYEEWQKELEKFGFCTLELCDDCLKNIEYQMRLNPEDIRRVIAMCVRRFHSSTTIQYESDNPLKNLFIEAMSHHRLGLKRKYDEVIIKHKWSPSMLKSEIESLKDEAAQKQLENYHKKMRYIVWGLSGKARLGSGRPFTTNFYMYSRALNKRFFNSLDVSRNRELFAVLDKLSKKVE